jgi:thiol:disulfide interchange protein
MKKANSTNKVLIGLTMLFMMIAGLSFAAFRETEEICTQAKNCTPASSKSKGGEMLWDVFSRGFISVVAIK